MKTASRFQLFKEQVHRVWALSLPYFQSREKWKARALLAAIVALNLASVYMLVLMNDWNRVFYDALQNKDEAVFWTQLARFTYLAFGLIIIAVYRFYLTQLLEMRWRAWMTDHYLERWLAKHAFYRMELGRYQNDTDKTTPGKPAHLDHPDNPDQRIQEDVNQFTSYTVSLTMGLFNAVVTLVSFVGILWGLSGGFAFNLGGTAYSIPGYMVWAAVLYCAAGSVISHYIGRPQIRLNFEQQRLEADFRHHLVRVREYSESIALDKGEPVERKQLEGRFSKVLSNYLALLKAQKNLTWFTVGFGQAAVVFPMIVAAPRYFSGAIQLGELTQISGAFGRVQDSLSWFVDNYSTLAAWRATTDRLTSFEESFRALALVEPAEIATNSVALKSTDLSVALPSGALLLSQVALSAQPGDSVLLQGPSGSGKSTLFRTIAGIWPFSSGSLTRPRDAMFIPQRPYFPNGPLRDALAYPEAASRYEDAALKQALSDALLPALVDRLDDVGAWGQQLSGGEQQRLAIARVFLKSPTWVFADEATSALDVEAEEKLYKRLLALVQHTQGAIISIAHRPSVAAFHASTWALERQPEGAASLYRLKDSRA
jgi:vitamin B12/bleomycin/antimicrobial peptide transport system ATP-binding/permease protein